MPKKLGKNHAQSMGGVPHIPSANPIRNLLDPVPPETVSPLMAEIGEKLYQHGYLASMRSVNDTLLMPIDGTNFFGSQKISCPCCSQPTLNHGKTLYRHTAITPVMVAPRTAPVVPLPPVLVTPTDRRSWEARLRNCGIQTMVKSLGHTLFCLANHYFRWWPLLPSAILPSGYWARLWGLSRW